MSKLGAAERASLRKLYASFKATEKESQAGGALADQLRTGLPDLDDVTLGRVVVELGKFVAQIAGQNPEAFHLQILFTQLVAAGYDLTSIELQDGAS